MKERIFKALAKFFLRRLENKTAKLKTNVGIVELRYPKDGGVESVIPNAKYPFAGIPDEKIVEKVSTVKKMFPMACKYAWLALRDKIPDTNLYCRPVRELHRVLSEVRIKEGEPEMRGMWTEIRDILCMILEFDDAYRFRFMEAINSMDIKQFEFTEADKYWAEMKWKYDWSWKKGAKIK